MEVATEDADLLLAWRDGDTASGEALFGRYYTAVARFFANKVSRDHADLVQATFSACLAKVDQLATAASFRAFLFGVARFELLHYYRRKSRRETDFDVEHSAICDLDPSPSRILAKREEQRLLLEGLRHIPLDLQIVLELSYWEELTSVEIADLLKVPQGTIKSRVRRAKELLNAKLAELSDSSSQLESTVTNLAGWAAELRGHVGAKPS